MAVKTPTNAWSCVVKVISRNIEPDNPTSHSSVFTILQSVYPAGEGMRGYVFTGVHGVRS